MHEVCVTHDFSFPPEKVFAGICDHAVFLTNAQIHCRLIRAGDTERNGCGAVREVRSGPFRFEEEITNFNSPHDFEYRIRTFRGPLNFKMPFHHEMGRIQLETIEQQTRVTWVSRFHFSIPLIGIWLDRQLSKSISDTFNFFLSRLDARLNK